MRCSAVLRQGTLLKQGANL